MFELPTQLWSIVIEMVNVRAIMQMNQDDDDTDWEIINDESEDAGESTLSSDIEKDDLAIRQQVLHLGQARHDKTIQTTWVSLPKNRSRADNVIACTPLPNLRHQVAAVASPLLKLQKSAINISHGAVVVQELPLPKAGGDHNVPEP